MTLAANVLNAALGDLCAKMRLAQNLVANSNDVKALVRAKWAAAPLPDDSQLTRGWRARAVVAGTAGFVGRPRRSTAHR